MSKKLSLILIVACFFHSTIKAQPGIDIAGVYNSTTRQPEGSPRLYVLDNKKFIITFFGGMRIGNWQVLNDSIIEFRILAPTERFEVYGRQNPQKTDSVRLFISDADQFRDSSYVGLINNKAARQTLHKVFNSDANCFDWPHIAMVSESHADSIVLRTHVYKQEINKWQTENAVFPVPEGYNDFILIKNTIPSDMPPFYGVLRNGMLYTDDFHSNKRPLSDWDEDQDIRQFVQKVITCMDRPDTLYYNGSYNNSTGESDEYCNNPDINLVNFRYDKARNAMVLKNVKDDELGSSDDSYHDWRIVYFFVKLKGAFNSTGNYSRIEKPLLIYKCGSEDDE